MTPDRDISTSRHPLSPPSLEELAEVLAPALAENYTQSSVSVVDCPDLRNAPFHLAAAGLSGDERVADIGGQPNLYPEPQLDVKYSLIDLAQRMELPASGGQLLGAGAGPFHIIGQNCELAPNLAWTDSFTNVTNKTYYTRFSAHDHRTACHLSPSTDCALMMNLYGSAGAPGRVLRVHASGRRRQQQGSSGDGSSSSQGSLTECLRAALTRQYGDAQPVSVGGVFAVRRGTARYHVMPTFPPRAELPWTTPAQLNAWLTFHDFAAPMTCLTVFHSADPEQRLGLRMEHTHCFSAPVDGGGGDARGGGHYHYDLLPEERDGAVEEIEYEGYFNVAKWIYRIDRPDATFRRDLHD